MNLAQYMLYSLKKGHISFLLPITAVTPSPIPKVAVVERFDCMTTLTAIDP